MLGNWSPSNDLLRDRVILVTGAADGIGEAAALEFAARGATVILLDKNLRKLETVYDAIENAGHATPALYPLNLETATPTDYDELASRLDETFGRLDGILHNAAVLGALTPVAHLEPELWAQTLQVNLSAPFLLTRSCLGLLQQSGDASVVFTTDEVAEHGKAYWGAYAVSKAGLECFAQVLAAELESNSPVRVNCVDPGPVATALRTIAYPAAGAGAAHPAQVLRPFLYLMSTDSAAINGQRLRAQQPD